MAARVKGHSFVIRVWRDENGLIWGQIRDPMEDWHAPFANPAELGRILSERMAQLDDEVLPPARESHRAEIDTVEENDQA